MWQDSHSGIPNCEFYHGVLKQYEKTGIGLSLTHRAVLMDLVTWPQTPPIWRGSVDDERIFTPAALKSRRSRRKYKCGVNFSARVPFDKLRAGNGENKRQGFLKKYRFVAYASGWLKGPYEFLKGVVAFI
jgi:hypothetical protein